MKLHTCYLCDTPITAENKTTEHIILNAIGGRLKAGYLLCRSCNSTAGHRADAALAKQLEVLTALLGIERERGDIPVLKGGKSEDGKEYDFYGEKIVPSKPVFIQA